MDWNFLMKLGGFVEEEFWHKTTKFYWNRTSSFEFIEILQKNCKIAILHSYDSNIFSENEQQQQGYPAILVFSVLALKRAVFGARIRGQNISEVYFKRCSKWPPSERIFADSLFLKARTALSIYSCDRLSQMEWRTAFSSFFLHGLVWYFSY